MIKRITFTQEVSPFMAGTIIQFNKGINLVCGDQGTGKSTLLEAIMMHDREFAKHVILEQDGTFKAFAYYNSELHNPRIWAGGGNISIGETRYSATLEMFYNEIMGTLKSSRLTNSQHFQTIAVNAYAKCKNMSHNVIDKKLLDLDVIARTAMQSHGEALFPFLEEALKVQGGIVFLDEPETSLSIKSQLKLASMLNRAAGDNQIFIATHSEILIRAVNTVLSLDEEKPSWMEYTQFLDKQHGL